MHGCGLALDVEHRRPAWRFGGPYRRPPCIGSMSVSTLDADAHGARPAPAPATTRPMSLATPARVALALALAALALLPAAWLVATALPVLGRSAWLSHFALTTLPRQALTSLGVAAEAAVYAFAAGALPAVLVSRRAFRGRGLVSVLCLLPLLLPPHVGAGLWTTTFASGVFDGRHALALELGLCSAPYLFIVFRIAAARMPRALAEMAASLGHDRLQRLVHVHAPAYAVPVAAGALIVFAQATGDYGAAERIGVDTLSVGVHNLWFASQDATVAAIVSGVMTLPAALLVIATAWAATSIISQNASAPASWAAPRQPLPRPAAIALVVFSAGCALPGFAVPEAIALRWAWLKWDRTRFAAIPGDTLNALGTSLATALAVCVVCALVALLMRSGARARVAERLPWLFLVNYFLPPLVLALAFVLMTRDGSAGAALLGDARDSRLVIVVAQTLRYLPFAMLPVLDALRRTPPTLIELARACGAGPWCARAHAFAAHLWPALLLGAALVFMESLKELELSLTLQPFGYSSPALKVYAFSRHQNLDRAAVWVLLTQLLMLPPLVLLCRRMNRLDRGPNP